MSALAAVRAPEHRDDLVLGRSQEALDLPPLIARGWEAETFTFCPPQSDPLFGWTLCERVGCRRGGYEGPGARAGLCDGCYTNYRNTYVAKGVSVDEYKQMPYRATRRPADGDVELCLVCRTPDHERRVRRGKLCQACAALRSSRGQTLDQYVNGDDRFPPAAPRRTLPPCEMRGCEYDLEIVSHGLCRACDQRWRKHRAKDDRLTLEQFKRLGMFSCVSDGRTVDLSGLTELVRTQFLLGLQRLIHLGMQAPPSELELIARRITQQRVDDLRFLDHTRVANRNCAGRVAKVLVEAAEDAATTLDEELLRESWRVRVIFPAERKHRWSSFSFEDISQPWLRELAKLYCASRLGDLQRATLNQAIRRITRFSTFLAATDRGTTPDQIDRHDIDRYVASLHARKKRANEEIAALRELLRFARRRGHTQPGRLAAGLRDDVVVLSEDTRRRRHPEDERGDDEPGRAIPEYVIAQLLESEALALLHPTYAAATELVAHIGRRPIEVCELWCDCLVALEEAADGRPRRWAIRYRRAKPPAKTLTLPIHEDTAALIRVRIREVQAQFPGRPKSKLKLFPRPKMNPAGDLAISSSSFSTRMRRWVDALPKIVDELGEDFDRSLIFPYAFRHSYAQRHADAGTALDVLQKLMDHRSPTTTQGYYRVRDERLFEAVRTLGPMTIDAWGRDAGTSYPDADELARNIGQIPVPLGHCVEPHNVKTLGSACPFSHQCLGCEHYRTDPSYLPDLYAYLERLLDAQERLRASVPELAEWARAKALPNDDEIRAVRNLIRSNEELLGELPEADRHKLEELFRTLRSHRASVDGALPVHQVAGARQSAPSFTPPAFKPVPVPRKEAV